VVCRECRWRRIECQYERVIEAARFRRWAYKPKTHMQNRHVGHPREIEEGFLAALGMTT
jgi:hypothetical protein